MSDNKDVKNRKGDMSVDDILNEYSDKKPESAADVDDIINEVRENASESFSEPDQEMNEASERPQEYEDEKSPAVRAVEAAASAIGRVHPMGGIFDKLSAQADELDNAVDPDGSKEPESAERAEVPEDSASSREQDSQTDKNDLFSEDISGDTVGEDACEESAAEPDGEDSGEKSRYRRNPKNRGADFTLRTDDDEDPSKRPSRQSEYERPEDKEKIMTQIVRLKTSLTVRAAALLFAAVFSFIITAANDFSLSLVTVFDRTVNPSAYLFTNTLLALISVGFSYQVIYMGFRSFFARRPDSDSVAALGIIAAIIAGIATLFDPESFKSGFYHCYTTVAIAGLFCNTLGKLSVVRRTQRNFEIVCQNESYSALYSVDDEQTAAYVTGGSSGRRRELAAMKKTSFIKDFMKNSYSSDLADGFAERTAPVMLAAAFIIGLMSLFFEKNSSGTSEKLFVFLASVSGTLSICSSFALTLIVNTPLSKASKKLADYSGVILGYSSAEEFSEINSVLLDAGHLFPRGSVDIENIKVLGSTLIDECIIYAASMSAAGGSVTQPAFYKMLRGDLSMLEDVTGCECDGNLGVSGWIESKRTLLGNRSLMERHGVDGLPAEEAEGRFAGQNEVMYLAISGRAVMMFSVSINVGMATRRWVQELEDEFIELHIRCSDGFITREKLARSFDVSVNSIKLLSPMCGEDYKKITESVDEISASMFCSGHFPTFAMLLVAAKRIKFSANIGIAIQYGALVLGIGIAAIMMATGAFLQITPTVVMAYDIVFLLLTRLVQSFKRI